MTAEAPQETAVRIGELHVLRPGATASLVAVGLGSCAGVAIVDERSGAAALAHVFLPERPDSGGRPGAGDGTYADVAIPALVAAVEAAAGSSATRLVAVVAGGSQMFGARPGSDVGSRNVEAVRAALARAGVRVEREDVGGRRGRTMRIDASDRIVVTVRVVGSEPQELWASGPARETGWSAAA